MSGLPARARAFALRFVLVGRYADHAVRVELRRADLTQEPLVARGFHWIQEAPYNR
jgi:hypothetical protein